MDRSIKLIEKNQDKLKSCGICLGLIKPMLPIIKCKCGKIYHDTCASRVNLCPVCGKKLITADIDKMIRDAIEHSKSNNIDRSIEIYDEILTLNEGKEEYALFNKGVLLFNKGNYSQSRDCFERTLSIRPDFIFSMINIAAIDMMEGDDRNAFKRLKKVIELDPKNKQAVYNMGLILQYEGEYDEAIKLFMELIKLDPNDYLCLTMMAESYLNVMDIPRAKAVIEDALRINDDHYLSHYIIGRIAFLEGDTTRAIKSFHKSLTLNKTHIPSIISMIKINISINKIHNAFKGLQQLIEIDPKNKDISILKRSIMI